MYDSEVSRRIHETAVQQIGVRNLTTEHLVAHGPTAVRASSAKSVGEFWFGQVAKDTALN